MDALHRSAAATADVASYAAVVDARNDVAGDFYENYGFVQLPDHPHRLFLPMNVIKKLL